jgi:hypothetical protein
VPTNKEDPVKSADPKGQKKRREKQVSNHTGKGKDSDDRLSGNALQSYNNSFFVFLAVGLGKNSPGFLPDRSKAKDPKAAEAMPYGRDRGVMIVCFKPRALHGVRNATMKARSCFCFSAIGGKKSHPPCEWSLTQLSKTTMEIWDVLDPRWEGAIDWFKLAAGFPGT